MKTIATVLFISLFTLASCTQNGSKTANNESSTPETETTNNDKLIAENEVKTISMEQIDGEFTKKELTLEAGTYIFEIENNGVDHEVGFVLTPEGKTDEANHIKEAYVTAPVKNGTSSKTNEVTLEKGVYTYFCPLNPTPEYTLTVN
ncbi:MAG: hypothetical protein ACPGVD_06940 [Flavobacteriales bacterium]